MELVVFSKVSSAGKNIQVTRLIPAIGEAPPHVHIRGEGVIQAASALVGIRGGWDDCHKIISDSRTIG